MILRDYQNFAVESVFDYFKRSTGNPVIAMPTGTGKSLVIGDLIHRILKQWPTQRIMMLTHVKELIEQNADKLLTMWPQAPIGIYSAGLGEKEARYPITFAGVQSAVRAKHLFGHVDLVIVDECHLVSPNANTSYQILLAALKEINPLLKVIGLSATAYRLGLGLITEGGLFTDFAVDMTAMDSFNWFIDEGYLSMLLPQATDAEIDATGVAMRGGEFVEKEAQNAVMRGDLLARIVDESIERGAARNRCLVFAAGIDAAERMTAYYDNRGESAMCVHSKMTPAQRDAAFAMHRSGEAKWLVGNNIFTTGYDDPAVDLIVSSRLTNSPGLWVQLLGRGTRPLYHPQADLSTTEGRLAGIHWGGKQNCLVLDFAANSLRLGPINDPVLPKPKGTRAGEPPIKICTTDKLKRLDPEDEKSRPHGCGMYNHPSAKKCINCGNEFDFKPKLVATASTAELIRRKRPEVDNKPAVQLEDFDVDTVVYSVHTKLDTPNSLKVTYHCGLRRFSEWVPAWHTSGVRHKGKAWWEERTDVPLPDSADEACEMAGDELITPKRIRVWVNQKWPEIVRHEF